VGIVHYIPLILTRNCELYESGIQLTIDGKGPYQLKAITSLFCYVHTPLFRGGTAVPPPDLPFPDLSFPFIQFNAGRPSQFLCFSAPLSQTSLPFSFVIRLVMHLL
jgi:hypothetical protein